jgi:hypothetical protein
MICPPSKLLTSLLLIPLLDLRVLTSITVVLVLVEIASARPLLEIACFMDKYPIFLLQNNVLLTKTSSGWFRSHPSRVVANNDKSCSEKRSVFYHPRF